MFGRRRARPVESCYDAGHRPCWLCQYDRALAELTPAQFAEVRASDRADRARERAAAAATAGRPAAVPAPRTSTVRW